MNPIIFALLVSMAANGLLGWTWLAARDDLAVATTQRDAARAQATECGKATGKLRSLSDKRKKEAATARASAAASAQSLDKRADYTLGLQPKDPTNSCASMQALGDEWIKGRVAP